MGGIVDNKRRNKITAKARRTRRKKKKKHKERILRKDGFGFGFLALWLPAQGKLKAKGKSSIRGKMQKQQENRGKQYISGRPERSTKKALLDLYEMSQGGFSRSDRSQQAKQKSEYPYGYGLGFVTRTRLFLRTINLMKVRMIFTFAFLGWMLLTKLIFDLVPDLDSILVILWINLPFFMLGCLGFLILFRGQYPDVAGLELKTKRGSYAKEQGLLMMVSGFGLTIWGIVRIVQILLSS